MMTTRSPWRPSYLALLERGELDERAALAREELRDCRACPRVCSIDRLAGETTVCHTGRHAIVSSAFPHFGEEDCLRGTRGSGTIFFSLCNLRCVFCQNWAISQRASGREMDAEALSRRMLELQAEGCHNINLVTPEHVAPQVVEAVAVAARRGLRLPIVYNTSAYDALSSLRLLDGIVDIYMPDFKFWRPETAKRLAKAADYPARAREAIAEMHRQVGPLELDEDGLARRGLLVRHLVMPGQGDETEAILRWLAEALSVDTYVNLMGQYRPAHEVGILTKPRGAKTPKLRHPCINRRPQGEELAAARAVAHRAGLWRLDARA